MEDSLFGQDQWRLLIKNNNLIKTDILLVRMRINSMKKIEINIAKDKKNLNLVSKYSTIRKNFKASLIYLITIKLVNTNTSTQVRIKSYKTLKIFKKDYDQ